MNAGLLYREGTVGGANPISLVARLYEQTIEDLRRAIRALERNDVEQRTNKINHAILVIGYLESQLDFTAGGEVAENLKNFYDSVRANLVRAQFQQSRALLAQQITDLLAVREAWIEVERTENPAPARSAELIAASAATPASDAAHLDWKA